MDVSKLQIRLREFADARDWEQFHSPKNLSMALAAEAGELLEIFQWLTEEQSREPRDLNPIRHEIGDLFIYLLRLCDQLGIDPERAILDKLDINEQKYPVSKSKGNAKKYTEL